MKNWFICVQILARFLPVEQKYFKTCCGNRYVETLGKQNNTECSYYFLAGCTFTFFFFFPDGNKGRRKKPFKGDKTAWKLGLI